MNSRNSLCSCGSGRRYKHCCGAIGADTAASPADAGEFAAVMQAALDHQRAGRLDEADRLYARALQLAPGDFDALHMAGVVAYQRGQYFEADRNIRAALQRRPSSQEARFNLDLVQQAFAVDNEFCRRMLAQLAREGLPVQPARADFGAGPLHVLTSAVDVRDEALELMHAMAAATQSGAQLIWLHPGDDEPWADAPASQPLDAARLDGARLLVAGTHFDAAESILGSGCAELALLCDAPAYREVADRIRQLSDNGERPLQLWFGSAELQARLGLAGRCFDPALLPRGEA